MSSQPRRSPKRQSRKSPTSSLSRRPLHARSDSDINVTQGHIATPERRPKQPARTTAEHNVFPKLPSQIFSPDEQLRILESDSCDQGAGRRIVRVPDALPRSPKSPPQSSSWRTELSGLPSRTETMSTDMWQVDGSNQSLPPLSPSAQRPPGSLVNYMRKRFELVEAEARLSTFSFERGKSPKSLPSSPRSQRAELITLASSVAENIDQSSQSPSLYDAAPATFERPELVSASSAVTSAPIFVESSPQRPASSRSTLAVYRDNDALPEEDFDLRPVYSNPAAHTDAFLQELIGDGVAPSALQYAKLKKPSISTVASDTSSVRLAYPAPLRLRKKRGDAHLAKRAALQATEGRTLSRPHSRRLRPSPSNVSNVSSLPWPLETNSRPVSIHNDDPNALRWSRNWADEIDDVVAELYPNPLRHQASYYSDSPFSSKVSLDEPSVPRDSFYYWFNDSHVKWAKSFYRGGGKLPLETPPSVTVIEPRPTSPIMPFSPKTPYSSRCGSSRDSIPSESPPSVGYPEHIYIPRSRPMVRGNSRLTHAAILADADSDWEDIETSAAYSPKHGPSTAQFSRINSDSMTIPHDATQATFLSSSSNYSIRQSQLRCGEEAESSDIQQVPRHRGPSNTSNLSQDLIPPPAAHFPPHAESPRRKPRQTSRRSVQRARRSASNQTFLHYRQASLRSYLPRPQRQASSSFAWALPQSIVPHLCLDRRRQDAIPIWSAPSMDDQPGPFNKLNRQIWLFFLGFFFPFAWMVAAFLPIPPRPCWRSRAGSHTSKDACEETMADTGHEFSSPHARGRVRSGREKGVKQARGLNVDTEAQTADLFDALEVWRYRKARWWRITNRFMSVTGLCIIAAVVACAIVATK